jgi:hypothetical protein
MDRPRSVDELQYPQSDPERRLTGRGLSRLPRDHGCEKHYGEQAAARHNQKSTPEPGGPDVSIRLNGLSSDRYTR